MSNSLQWAAICGMIAEPRPPSTHQICSIYEKIGRGKHSTVYKGRKKKSIQYYAIKSVEKSQKNRVLQEVSESDAREYCKLSCTTRDTQRACVH